jgi:hypothetical protein
MNSPFHLTVRRALKRMASSCERASAWGHSRTPKESAYSAPHAPYKSECRTAGSELRAEFCRPTSDGDGLKQLRLRTFDRQIFALKARKTEWNSVSGIACPCAYRKQFPRRVWSVPVAELNPSGAIQRVLCIVQCLRQMIPEHEIRAQLRFQLPPNNQQSQRPPVPKARQIQGTIETHRLTEAPQLPLLANKRPRSRPQLLARNTSRTTLN